MHGTVCFCCLAQFEPAVAGTGVIIFFPLIINEKACELQQSETENAWLEVSIKKRDEALNDMHQTIITRFSRQLLAY
jgi:hypothetical protein